MSEAMETNRRHWDEVVAIHVASDFYDVASFKAGRNSLLGIERDEVGDVAGKSLLHLQCHFGMDTLSWARLGASVTGVDFSPNAIATARALAAEVGIDARFVESNIYDLPANLEGQFDIVFASYGVLCWIPDMLGWARVAAHFLKPGGFFYIVDGHPLANVLDNATRSVWPRWERPYFTNGQGSTYADEGTYADPTATIVNKQAVEFQRSLGEIVTAFIDAGLRLDFLHESPLAGWQAEPSMVKGDDGYWRLPSDENLMPMLFSLKATKPPLSF